MFTSNLCTALKERYIPNFRKKVIKGMEHLSNSYNYFEPYNLHKKSQIET